MRAAYADDAARAAVDATARVGDVDLVLNGAGLRKMFTVDVYVIGIYLTERTASPQAVINGAGPKRIALKFSREVTAKALVQALYEGVRDTTSEADFARIRPAADALAAIILPFKIAKPGDVVALDYVPNTGSQVVVNGRRADKAVPGSDLYRALLKIWIGDAPVDKQLKRALLGG